MAPSGPSASLTVRTPRNSTRHLAVARPVVARIGGRHLTHRTSRAILLNRSCDWTVPRMRRHRGRGRLPSDRPPQSPHEGAATGTR